MPLNLIWGLNPQSLAEADWIHWLFSKFEVEDHITPGWDLFRGNSIYIVSGPLARLPSRFLEGIKGVQRKGLFHLSDESFVGGYDIYAAFDFVLRNYYSSIFQNAGIRTVPLGFTNEMMGLYPTPPANEWRFLWSFAGFKRAARLDMFEHFKSLQPYQCYFFGDKVGQPWLNRTQFRALLSNSVFSPCPMGNTVLESFRIYESLEMQCIPILERRRWMPYYDCLMPGHPLLTFLSWREARQFVQAVSRDGPRMVAYQQEIAEWWRS